MLCDANPIEQMQGAFAALRGPPYSPTKSMGIITFWTHVNIGNSWKN